MKRTLRLTLYLTLALVALATAGLTMVRISMMMAAGEAHATDPQQFFLMGMLAVAALEITLFVTALQEPK